MNTWWSAIDRKFSSYEELKHRKVVAQGWRHLGDIGTLARFIPDTKAGFVQAVQLLGDVSYRNESWWDDEDRNESRAPTVMWNLFNVQVGDLVVALEGTVVHGVCQVSESATESYRYQQQWEYAQTIGFPVTWHDWTPELGETPTAPRHGILGIRGLVDGSDHVQAAWSRVSR